MTTVCQQAVKGLKIFFNFKIIPGIFALKTHT